MEANGSEPLRCDGFDNPALRPTCDLGPQQRHTGGMFRLFAPETHCSQNVCPSEFL